jgi:CubicO group peptidase (beta-lactamase class C family)
MSGALLDGLRDSLAQRETTALLVARHNKLVYEWYALGHGYWRREGTASLAKSIVGSMALLAATDDGLIELDDPVSKFIPDWRNDPIRSQITVRQIMTHSSGIGHGRDKTSEWSRAFWERRPDLFEQVLENAPVLDRPGSRFRYSGPAFAPLSYALAHALQDTPTPDLRQLLANKVMRPIGIPDAAWTISYGRTFELDGLRLHATWSGAAFTPPAIARVGQFVLMNGAWDGQQLVDSSLVAALTGYSGAPLPEGERIPAPTPGWWSNANGAWPHLPRDAFAGLGAGGQLLIVAPSTDLVAVRLGGPLTTTRSMAELWEEVYRLVIEPLAMSLIE